MKIKRDYAAPFSRNSVQLLLSLFLFSMMACIPQKGTEPESLKIPTIKVLIAKIFKQDTLKFNGSYFLDTEEARYEFGTSNREVFILPLKTGFKIYNENRLFLFRESDEVRFVSKDKSSSITFEDKKYAGNFTILMEDSTNLLLVNEIDLESYLQGVVPAEIFTNNEEQIEAIKAQAICARTYALKKMNSRQKQNYHVFADVRDQVYGGIAQRTKLGDQAIIETTGSSLFFKAKFADTFFHASCGGSLEDAADVWQGPKVPYLKAQQDVFGKVLADIESPYFRWEKERSATQLDSMFNEKFSVSYLNKIVQDTIDVPIRMYVKERSPSGRVLKMSVSYGTDQHELKGYEIRRFLGWPIGNLLPSTLFTLSSSDSTIIINGAGNGHGVGMCQFGALYKAQKGLKYYHILQSYFPGTVLKKVY